MSTRANITITNGESKIILYRHMDGYPTETGLDIITKIKETKNAGQLIASFLSSSYQNYNDNIRPVYEITTEIHGDIDYHYEINIPRDTYNFHKEKDGEYPNLPTMRVTHYYSVNTYGRREDGLYHSEDYIDKTTIEYDHDESLYTIEGNIRLEKDKSMIEWYEEYQTRDYDAQAMRYCEANRDKYNRAKERVGRAARYPDHYTMEAEPYYNDARSDHVMSVCSAGDYYEKILKVRKY